MNQLKELDRLRELGFLEKKYQKLLMVQCRIQEPRRRRKLSLDESSQQQSRLPTKDIPPTETRTKEKPPTETNTNDQPTLESSNRTTNAPKEPQTTRTRKRAATRKDNELDDFSPHIIIQLPLRSSSFLKKTLPLIPMNSQNSRTSTIQMKS